MSRYGDPDINTSPADIVYTRRGIPNGSLYRVGQSDVQVRFLQIDYSIRMNPLVLV